MIDRLAENLVNLKKQFTSSLDQNSNTQEIIPRYKSEQFPIEEKYLKLLHLFASKNPIYYDSIEKKISGIDCIIYQGDINEYWLGSISNDSGHAPFSPTWILSAFIATLQAKKMGYREIIDIGSGDGRIAYCAKILGMRPHSIEIDSDLVTLQKTITSETGFDLGSKCADVIEYDFGSLSLQKPAFFIGSLAQIGGNILASSILKNIKTKNAGFVFAGTLSKKYVSSQDNAGWGELMKKWDLDAVKTISLPTAWTFKEPQDTPYIFAEFR